MFGARRGPNVALGSAHDTRSGGLTMVDQSSGPVVGRSPADVVRRAHDAFAIGDIDAVMTLCADEITFHIPGTSPLSGIWAGRERVLEFFAKAAELSEGTLALSPDEVLAEPPARGRAHARPLPAQGPVGNLHQRARDPRRERPDDRAAR